MRYLPALILALAAIALAQEPARPEQTQHTPTGEAAPAAGTTAPAKKREQTPVQQAADDERFVPSESISEDLSVSFPSDI